MNRPISTSPTSLRIGAPIIIIILFIYLINFEKQIIFCLFDQIQDFSTNIVYIQLKIIQGI